MTALLIVLPSKCLLWRFLCSLIGRYSSCNLAMLGHNEFIWRTHYCGSAQSIAAAGHNSFADGSLCHCLCQSLTVLEYLVANGSERVIDELREHTYHIQVSQLIYYWSHWSLMSWIFLWAPHAISVDWM
jgi:hypothetical protein